MFSSSNAIGQWFSSHRFLFKLSKTFIKRYIPQINRPRKFWNFRGLFHHLRGAFLIHLFPILIRCHRLTDYFFLLQFFLIHAILHFQLMAELLGVQVVVMSALAQEFGVRALLGDRAVLDDEDTVGAADGAQAVRDDEGGASLHQRFHAALDQGLGQRVHGGGGLVHDEEFGLGQHGARERDQLLLSHREQVAAFAHVLVITLVERDDEVVRARDLGGFFHFRVGRVQPPVADVLAHRPAEQVRGLQHDPDLEWMDCSV